MISPIGCGGKPLGSVGSENFWHKEGETAVLAHGNGRHVLDRVGDSSAGAIDAARPSCQHLCEGFAFSFGVAQSRVV
jgi:hypothetical protein